MTRRIFRVLFLGLKTIHIPDCIGKDARLRLEPPRLFHGFEVIIRSPFKDEVSANVMDAMWPF